MLLMLCNTIDPRTCREDRGAMTRAYERLSLGFVPKHGHDAGQISTSELCDNARGSSDGA
jgi:hypothetical protein